MPPFGAGILYFDPVELTTMVLDFAARGFQVCIHAHDDRAIEIVLDAYAQTLAGTQGNRALTARAAQLRIPVVSQPGFLSDLGDGFTEAFGGQAHQAVRVPVMAAGRDRGRRILRRTGHHAGPVPVTVVDGTPTYQAGGIIFPQS